jgi:hypothetical protein
VRAAMLRLPAPGRIEVIPLPGLAGMFELPRTILPVDQWSYRLFSPSVIQQWDSRGDKIDKIELPSSRLPPSSKGVLIDAHQIIVAGGELPTGDDRRDADDPVVVDDVFRFDVDRGRLERLPLLSTPRLGPFVVQLADGRIMVGAGREGGRRVLWGAIAECAAAFFVALAGLAGLVLLAVKVRPRPGTLVLAVLAGLLALALLGLRVLT